ncbi:hypothetical protein [Idiomarina aquatica]|uniref:Uncharacterized protein n=1 Tax=Idiomarina aquatica TaxID=1327752 RepID=A0AA94EH47_9GAMM|nr:hypothetical protein [Idiomarina aquatica]RUO44983.1 hypothetical protein CWE23_02845 [Idiomarina aquatica]
MIKLIGVIPTARARYDEMGNEITAAQYNDLNYYAISHERIKGLSEVSPDRPLPAFASNTHYYAFPGEAEAKQALNYNEEDETFDVEFMPTTEQFKQSRQEQLDNAVVTTQSGKEFDADEASMSRMVNALTAASDEPDTVIIPWSLANDGTGVMTDCTKAEIKEAHRLAVENMAAIWSV